MANKMESHVCGSKRLKIIQNYLNGREIDEFEVFPTKTERKYRSFLMFLAFYIQN